jgi:uncharacterized repeat protein (TIGR01451 family)/CSLREA domain-containing protein
MSGNQLRRAFLVIPLALATLVGCVDTDTTAPKLGSNPLFAQGDNGVWTVNTLTDPGDGVCDQAHCTLREAIAAAASGDQITFGGLQGEIQLANGGLIIERGVTINGGGQITVNAHGSSTVLGVSPLGDLTVPVILDGLVFSNGFNSSGSGGAILIDASGAKVAVTIRNSTIIGSYSLGGDGGGIWIGITDSLTLINSTVSGNQAGVRGGGIWNQGTLLLVNSTVDGNTTAGSGGGIYNAGTLVVTGSTVSNNQASNGGGIQHGGGGSASIVLSTISGNQATSTAPAPQGAGIANFGALSLVSTTITKNSNMGLVQYSGSTTLKNSIIAGNAVGCVFLSGSQNTLGNNLSDDGNGCFLAALSDVHVSGAQVFTQVLESNLKDNGGPTMTHALIARGLAVDGGHCPAETIDQRGFTRPVDDPTVPNANDACDIGAYEAQGPLVAVADLMVSQAVDKNSVKQGELLTYTVRVQNLGPETAPNVVLNNVLSSGVTFVEARQNLGSVTAPPRGETGTVTWYLGDLADQANEFAEIVVTVLVKGKTTITNTATVTGDVADPNPANNTAGITVSVAAGKSGGKKG